jgi:hypothetical protein
MREESTTIMTPNTVAPTPSPDVIRNLMVAAMAAMQSAMRSDLRDIAVLKGLPCPWPDFSQDLRRDLYALDRLHGIHFGSVSSETRRPAADDLRTCIVPVGDGWRILVLCTGGDGAVYRPDGRKAALVVRGDAKDVIRDVMPASDAPVGVACAPCAAGLS